MMKTNATEANDARPVGFSKQLHALSAALAFTAFEKGSPFMSAGSIDKSYCLNAAEPVKDSAPAASVGDNWFHVAGLIAVSEGHISEEGLERVMAALYPEVQR